MPYPYPQTTAATTPVWPSYSTVQPASYPYPPVPKTIGIFGRFVNSVSEITPSEVPMDGSYAIFPLSDLSKVYIKAWKTDGTISTLEFSPEVKPEEWVCNFIADYAAIVFRAAYDILGADAWMAVPYELEKMIGVGAR